MARPGRASRFLGRLGGNRQPPPAGATLNSRTMTDTNTMSDSLVSTRVRAGYLQDDALNAVYQTDAFGRTITVASGTLLGTSDSGQSWAALSGVTSVAGIVSGVANIQCPASASGRKGASIDPGFGFTDGHCLVAVGFDSLPVTSGAAGTVGFAYRITDSGNFYRNSLLISDLGVIKLRRQWLIGGAATTNDTVIAGTYAANDMYWLRTRWIGTSHWMKAWKVGTVEPLAWTDTFTDSTYTTQSVIGFTNNGNGTQTNTLTALYDNLTVNLPSGTRDSAALTRIPGYQAQPTDTVSTMTDSVKVQPVTRALRDSVAMADSATWANDSSNGNNGGIITPANSVFGGFPWDSVVNTINYDNTHLLHSNTTVATVPALASTSVAQRLRWFSFTGQSTQAVARGYYWFPATLPSNGLRILQFNATAGLCACIKYSTIGIFNVTIAANTTAYNTPTIPTGQWVRIELRVLPSTTVGELELRLFWTNPDGVVPDFSQNMTGLVLASDIIGVDYGIASAPGLSVDYQFWMADMKIDLSGAWIGPTQGIFDKPAVGVQHTYSRTMSDTNTMTDTVTSTRVRRLIDTLATMSDSMALHNPLTSVTFTDTVASMSQVLIAGKQKTIAMSTNVMNAASDTVATSKHLFDSLLIALAWGFRLNATAVPRWVSTGFVARWAAIVNARWSAIFKGRDPR